MKMLGSRWLFGFAFGWALLVAMTGATAGQVVAAQQPAQQSAQPLSKSRAAKRGASKQSTHRTLTARHAKRRVSRESGVRNRKTASARHHPAPAREVSLRRGSRGTAAELKRRRAREREARYRRHLPRETAESRRLRRAFIASSELQPMAQQLLTYRTPAAYAGVLAYAASHRGEAAASAELALGHAYMLDDRYGDAEREFRQASNHGTALDDYADYLEAQAAVEGNHPQDAIPLLSHFAQLHPGSLFDDSAPILLATAYLACGDAKESLEVLQPWIGSAIGNHVEFRFALAHAYQADGNPEKAAALYRGIYLGDPLSPQATKAKIQLAAMNNPLSAADRKRHADALFNAKQYRLARDEYRALENSGDNLSQGDRDALEIYVALCDLRLNLLSREDVERLPVTGDDSAALKLYLESELARNAGDLDQHNSLLHQLMAEYPHSRWLEEALYSTGNMYLIQLDDANAAEAYRELVKDFPNSIYAPRAHWRAAWLSYRLHRYAEAAQLMDEQIRDYPAGEQVPGALYWRGRLYEDVDHNVGQALNYYNKLNQSFVNSYYAIPARERIAAIGDPKNVPPSPTLAYVPAFSNPELTDVLPENDPHLIKARLLANASLNEYIGPEIKLSDTSSEWGALAEAEIYQSFGETHRALHTMKRSGIPFFSLPVQDAPRVYWELLLPRPYWQTLEQDARANGLDPYLVAALIRQESEFNPGAVSPANACGLMQLLPSVGRSLARSNGQRSFNASELLVPSINLELGTQDLRKSIDRYSGQIDYALAAYNAGDTPVNRWISAYNGEGIAEWVESIPYTETRDYVEAILRNRELYRQVYEGR